MRDRSRDDEFGLPDMGDDAVQLPDAGVDLESGIDVGFDFLENMEGDQAQQDGRASDAAAGAPGPRASGIAIDPDDAAEFRARWADIQASFIDDPQRACEQADNLVDLILKRVTEQLTRDRSDLVRRWDRGSEAIPTDDLLSAMKGYRSMVERLLEADF